MSILPNFDQYLQGTAAACLQHNSFQADERKKESIAFRTSGQIAKVCFSWKGLVSSRCECWV